MLKCPKVVAAKRSSMTWSWAQVTFTGPECGGIEKLPSPRLGPFRCSVDADYKSSDVEVGTLERPLQHSALSIWTGSPNNEPL